jgi:hypothetical protein
MDDTDPAWSGCGPQPTDLSTLAVESSSLDAAAKADALIADGLTYLIGAADDGRRYRTVADPLGVPHGVAGVLATLVQVSVITGRSDLRDAVSRAAGLLAHRLNTAGDLMAGEQAAGSALGRAGVAWAMLDAAMHLNSDTLTARAIDLALRVPVCDPDPNLSHAIADAGMAQLHCWTTVGELAFLERAEQCADKLVAAAASTLDGPRWTVPPACARYAVDGRVLATADVIAGAGGFLLATALATGRDDLFEVAKAAAGTLVATAERGPYSARWPGADVEPNGAGAHGRYSDSSAIGTFLLRMWRKTGDLALLALAREAAAGTHCDRWFVDSSVWRGLAGNGDLLLDLADDGIPPAHAFATDLIECLYAHRVVQDGLRLVPDTPTSGVTIGYATGLSGVLSYLMRYRYGGRRLWQVDGIDVGSAPSEPGWLSWPGELGWPN